MATLTVLHYPDPRLRIKAARIDRVDDEIRNLARDMIETMYAAPGIGLAATQVNVPKRILVTDVSEKRDQPLCLINPRTLEQQGVVEMEEGCLSVPGVFEVVQRAERVSVKAIGLDGALFTLEAEGLLAVCIQLVMDHLDGKLFVDYLSLLKRNRIRKKLEKQQRQVL
ncbi:MAG: peptide deformylase [Gammaproteobacteria bacterium]